MEEILSVFAQEAREQLGEMESGLLRMEQGDHDQEIINGIFRAAHTIKGASGVVEIVHIERFTHVLENLLDKLRNGEIQVGSELISALLAGCDHLGLLLDRVEAGQNEPDAALQERGEEVADRLRAFTERSQGEAVSDLAQTGAVAVERDGDGTAMTDCWHVSIRFGQEVLRKGTDPLPFLRYLESLGEIVHIETLTDAIPDVADMDPEACYLGFEISLRSRTDKASIEQVFDFVRDDCDLRILPPHSRIGDYLELIHSLPEESLRLGEILVRAGALTQEELELGLRRQRASETLADLVAKEEGVPVLTSPPLGEILVQQHLVQSEIVEAAAAKQKQVADKKATESRLIRVQADKLDQLIDLVGELVIAGSAANTAARSGSQARMLETTSAVSSLVESIRDSALQLRMVQIGETFNRFHRVVRDVSKELGKDIDLVITGAETELDKTVVEKIGDPLMHLVRNSMDHGIEPADVRLARGKPAKGRVELNAFHDSGSIVIEVADDGGGLDRERIIKKAIERGLVQESDNLTEQEVENLIFEPGFSTADKVTNLSGRGVGMDVVKKNIQALRGSVHVSTTAGQGSRFTIRLPLTLAIIDGFLVGVGRRSYVIPLEMVVECVELNRTEGARHYINLRGEVLPFVRLRDLFDVPGDAPARENVVVVKSGGQKAGIVVDVLQGEFQAVIKPLSSIFRHLRGIGGSTILGSGEVALILDVQALTQLAADSDGRNTAAHRQQLPAAQPAYDN